MHGFEVEARSGDIPVDYNSGEYPQQKGYAKPTKPATLGMKSQAEARYMLG
jgi:hypothetical protein